MLIALEVVREVFYARNLDVVITSANDSVHKEGSYHYQGRAFDFRTKHAPGIIRGMVEEIKKVLGPLGFDVILEDLNGTNEHLHIELDKRAGY